jgi:hypothetical protein
MIKNVLTELNPFDSNSLKDTINGVLSTDAVGFDVQTNDRGISFFRLTSTRELLTDEIRNELLSHWQNALNILSKNEQLKARFDFSAIQGLAIRQSDYGFDTELLSLREDHHEHNTYRWEGCVFG